MSISKNIFGTISDQEVYLFTLSNSNGVVVKITTYGGIITELHTPDKQGKSGDIVLGYSTLEGYLAGHPYFGCITGRYANRIANGIFSIDGVEYQLAINNGPNSLHGGIQGFDKVIWQPKELTKDGAVGLSLKYTSDDMEEGYPGKLDVEVIYWLTQKNELEIEYIATTDKTTHINLTNHTYFNLSGCNAKVYDQELTLNAVSYTAVNENLIPTGKIESLVNGPLDFTSKKALGKDIEAAGGYDHNYILGESGKLKHGGRAVDPSTGRTMDFYTTEPAVQLYTGNWLEGAQGKYGVKYDKHMGFCLETQHYPDSPNHPEFPTTLLKPSEKFYSKTIYVFGN